MSKCGCRIRDVEENGGGIGCCFGDGCNVVDEGGDSVDKDNEAFVGNVIFAGTWILEETIGGGDVFADV